jgi:hypothetical protein
LAIAALILWVLTASAGVSLLRSGRAARGAAADPAPSAGVADGPGQTVGTPAGPGQADRTPADGAPTGPPQPVAAAGGPAQQAAAVGGAAPPADTPVRYAAVPLTEDGRPPPAPHAKVTAPPGEHPLLQFCHPALALIGFGFWLAFVLVGYRPLAWVSFGVLVVTLGAGLSWLTGNTLAARRQHGPAPAFPRRLIVLHGLGAAATLALTLLTALTAGHG